jgi:hypothetical protein
MRLPGTLGVGQENLPSHGDGRAGNDHTDGQNGKPLTQGRGIHGDGQFTAGPAAKHPSQQARETGFHVQFATEVT